MDPQVLYHGTNSKFDFKKDYDFAGGVGVIYTFLDKKYGIEFAKDTARDFPGYAKPVAYLYEIVLSPEANILDIREWNENTKEIADWINKQVSGQEIDNQKDWVDFATGKKSSMFFDVLDYNEELVSFLKEKYDGLLFVDGIDEIKKYVDETNVPVIVLFNTNIIKDVNVYEIPIKNDNDYMKKIEENHIVFEVARWKKLAGIVTEQYREPSKPTDKKQEPQGKKKTFWNKMFDKEDKG